MKRGYSILLTMVFLLWGCVLVSAMDETELGEKTTETDIAKFEEDTDENGLEEGQRKARIKIVSIEGNELTYYEIADQEEKTTDFETGKQQNREKTGTDADYGILSNTNQENRSMQKGMKRETMSLYLPVAVEVHTDIGKSMTFSILQTGDELEVLFEEDNGKEIITEIWMESTGGENG